MKTPPKNAQSNPLEVLEANRGNLSESDYQQLRAYLTGDRSLEIAGAASGVAVAGDNNEVRQEIEHQEIHLTVGTTPAEHERLLEEYQANLARVCRRLPLGVVQPHMRASGHDQQVRLDEIYVELDVSQISLPQVAAASDADAPGLEERRMLGEFMKRTGAERTAASLALSKPETRLTVLLGDPGSGKTTLAQDLCRRIAEGDSSLEAAASLVPLRFVLRDFAAALPADAQGRAADLWKATATQIAEDLDLSREKVRDDFLPWLRAHLREHGAFVVCDGLDEVSEAARGAVLSAIRDLAEDLGDASRVLVTARPYAYAEKRWRLPEFATLALARFSPEQVEEFVSGWYEGTRRAFQWSIDDARERAAELRRALAGRRYLRELASRPLLLTLMATLHSSTRKLPQDRADLYDETVKLLLSRWQVAEKEGAQIDDTVSQFLSLDENAVRAALARLAFHAHKKQGETVRRSEEADEEPADIEEGELLKSFRPLWKQKIDPDVLIAYLEQRAGLLVERKPRVWAFPHRSLQEYLAAWHVRSLNEPRKELLSLLKDDPVWWREAALLLIGSFRDARGTAVGIVQALIPRDPGEEESEVQWKIAVLAAEALAEMRLETLGDCLEEYEEILLKRARGWIKTLIQHGALEPLERVEAGDVLGELGDDRPGVGIRRDGLPDVEWRRIPEGSFLMGSTDEDPDAYAHEKKQHKVELGEYWISKYPVTNLQFQAFVDAGGYDDLDLWSEQGRDWLGGSEVDVSVYPEDLQGELAKWFAGRPKEKRRRPFFWDHEQLAAPTRPVVGVTFYEATAYCRWLSARLRADAEIVARFGADLQVSLPTEAQWEKAARGVDGQIWPWGNQFEPTHCNHEGSGIKAPSPVGLFPLGNGPYEVSDCIGNVWEWALSLWGPEAAEPQYSYPWREDERNREDVPGFRILRGGSWYNDKVAARCACRLRHAPGNFYNLFGFRIVLSLASSEF